MITILSQFISQSLNTITQWLSLFINFLFTQQVIISSIILGLITFLFLIAIIKPLVLNWQRKKYFTKKHNLYKSDSPGNKPKRFWRKNSFLNKFYETYQWANLPFTYEFFLAVGLIAMFSIFLIGLQIFTFTMSILFSILFIYSYFFIVRRIASHNYNQISTQLPFVLETLASSIQSGYSLRQSIEFTSQEIEMPFKIIFNKIVSQLHYNIPLNQVFTNIQKTTANQELKTVLDGLSIQDTMGGDIIKMLQHMAKWVRQKNKLQKDIKIFTSQGKLSGIIIALLWPVSASIFYMLNPDYISILFTDSTGKMFLMLSLFLEIIGFIMIWKIIKIKI